MAEIAIAHLGKVKRVADLFSGIGTFALRIARKSSVHAVESDDKAVKALDQAARNTQGLKPVTVERRDLFRRPMTPQELKVYDAVVFDPPRAGAEAQCRELALSSVKEGRGGQLQSADAGARSLDPDQGRLQGGFGHAH